MTKYITEARALARTWLSQWFPRRARARELLRQYRAMAESSPLAVADLLNFACAYSSTVGETPEMTLINTGKREVALHFITMTQLGAEDIRHLQERTDQDE